MSLQENITIIKEELNSEEKFFEQAVKAERFYKKYKKILVTAFVVTVVGFSTNVILDMNEKNRIASANEILMQFKQDTSNKELEAELEKLSPSLYSLYAYSKALKAKDLATMKELEKKNLLVLSDLSSYYLANVSGNTEALKAYVMKQDVVYRDMVQLEIASTLLSENKITKGQEVLARIDTSSPLAPFVKTLQHYGVK